MFGLSKSELKKAAFIPIVIVVLIFTADMVGQALGLPSAPETIELIKKLFINYGYILVFVASFIEALLLIVLYIPGSIALILASTLAGQGVMNIWLVILLI